MGTSIGLGVVEKIYRWQCGCGAIHESAIKPEQPLKCNKCGGQNGSVGVGKHWPAEEYSQSYGGSD